MARWKLMNNHYLNTVQAVEWEYFAVAGGKSVRKRFKVPRYLDVFNPADWTLKAGGIPIQFGGNDEGAEGAIIVCHEGRGEHGDIEFIGNPTPDMMPVDDEARAISATFEDHWKYKPDTAEMSFSQSLVDILEAKKADIETKPATVQVEGLSELMATMVASQKLMADLVVATHRRA